MRFKLFFFSIFLSFAGLATHNRAGYINYCWTGGTNYHVRIYTYTNFTNGNSGSDRCDQTLYIDGNQDSVICYRTNSTATCPNGGTPPGFDGQIIIPFFSAGNVKLNVYEGNISLNTGTHVLTMVDPNRDGSIINLPNSINRSFALIDTISISNSFGNHTNCSPFITNKPIDYACVGMPYCFNPQAVDPDNDSLDFSFTKSYEGGSGNPGAVSMMNDESIPSGITVDKHTGILCWNVPTIQGEYVLAMLIKEYRRNPIDGSMRLIGTTVLDIQVLVQTGCTANIAMTVASPSGCVVAGNTYTNTVSAIATGSSIVLPISLSAAGLPLTSTTIGQTAAFSSTSSGSTANGTFVWTPDCRAVQVNNYYVTIQANDANSPAYSNYSTFNIKVISPPPQNVVAVSAGSNINLSWAPPATCSFTTGNRVQKYLVYRNDTCKPYVPSSCQTGVPASSGYVLVGIISHTVGVSAYSFTDSNFGIGFSPGNTYSYIVVAQFIDGSLSLASSYTSSTCVTLKLDVPLITNVSVDTTDNAVGQIFVRWKNPNTDQITGLDTIISPGPYTYVLNRRPIGTATYTPIYTVTETAFYKLKKLQDTTFTDVLLDTKSLQYFYKVDFTTNNIAHGSSSPASSIFLSGVPHDKSVILSWNVQVPWTNTKYYILKQRYGGATDAYDIIGVTSSTSYTVDSLVNGWSYCFKILSEGQYANPNILRPLMNYSEKICVTPFDDALPCQPSLLVSGNCPTSINKLDWTNPNKTCGINDVVKYYIYFATFKDSALILIDSLLSPLDTSYSTDFASSIAGCYVIVAVDSVGNKSPLANEVCTDNCPEYELPNIFTPNGDNLNDQYIPVKNKYIKDVDFVMYNRWGEIVFETSDPALKWDGKSKQMKQPVSDGTYYYICTVHELHYYGIKERKLKGFVQILH